MKLKKYHISEAKNNHINNKKYKIKLELPIDNKGIKEVHQVILESIMMFYLRDCFKWIRVI